MALHLAEFELALDRPEEAERAAVAALRTAIEEARRIGASLVERRAAQRLAEMQRGG